MMKSLIFFLAVPTILSLAGVAHAQADYEGESSIELLYGSTFHPENTDIATLTLGHTGSYGAFEHFAFIDIYRETMRAESSSHLEWYPKLSLARAGGLDINPGLLEDILVGAGINADFGGESDLLAWHLGPVWKFNLPAFDSFQLETYLYKQVDTISREFNVTYQITPSWDIQLPVTDQWHFRLTGFADFFGDRGPGVYQILTQPQFLLDLGNFWNDPARIFVGAEWHYHHNVGGVEGVEESVLQLEVRVDL